MQSHPKELHDGFHPTTWSGKDPGRVSVPCRLAGAADGNGNWDYFLARCQSLGGALLKHSMSKDSARE